MSQSATALAPVQLQEPVDVPHGSTVWGGYKDHKGRRSGSVLRFEHVIVNLQDLSAPTSASGGCLSDGQGSQHNTGLLEQEDIPLIAR